MDEIRGSVWGRLVDEADVDVRLVVMPPGVRGACARVDGQVVVVVDKALPRVDRTAVLCHELEHLRRGGGCPTAGMPEAWWAVWARDELAVDQAVAAELVPAVELDVWLGRRDTVDEPTLVVDVAEAWEVTPRLAALALEDAWVRARALEAAAEAGQRRGCVPVHELGADDRARLTEILERLFGAPDPADPDAGMVAHF